MGINFPALKSPFHFKTQTFRKKINLLIYLLIKRDNKLIAILFYQNEERVCLDLNLDKFH